MKNRFIMPVALGAILTVSGCGDRGPVSPELPQGIETPLLKKTPAGPAQVEGEIGPGGPRGFRSRGRFLSVKRLDAYLTPLAQFEATDGIVVHLGPAGGQR